MSPCTRLIVYKAGGGSIEFPMPISGLSRVIGAFVRLNIPNLKYEHVNHANGDIAAIVGPEWYNFVRDGYLDEIHNDDYYMTTADSVYIRMQNKIGKVIMEIKVEQSYTC